LICYEKENAAADKTPPPPLLHADPSFRDNFLNKQ
jgi:hypothetical protein